MVSPPSFSLPETRDHRSHVPRHHLAPGKADGWPYFCCLFLALLPGTGEEGTHHIKTRLSHQDVLEPGTKLPGMKRAQPHTWPSSVAETSKAWGRPWLAIHVQHPKASGLHQEPGRRRGEAQHSACPPAAPSCPVEQKPGAAEKADTALREPPV